MCHIPYLAVTVIDSLGKSAFLYFSVIHNLSFAWQLTILEWHQLYHIMSIIPLFVKHQHFDVCCLGNIIKVWDMNAQNQLRVVDQSCGTHTWSEEPTCGFTTHEFFWPNKLLQSFKDLIHVLAGSFNIISKLKITTKTRIGFPSS